MAFRIRKAIGALASAVLVGAALLGVGCGGGDDSGSERAVKWWVEPPVGPSWVRARAVIEGCSPDPPLFEEPIIEYEDDHVYIELRQTPEDGKGICFLNLPIASKKITFERALDDLVLFDSSIDPPEQRWPIERRRPTE